MNELHYCYPATTKILKTALRSSKDINQYLPMIPDPAVKKLSGIENFTESERQHRNYSIQDEHLRILVVYVGHRRDVYERFS